MKKILSLLLVVAALGYTSCSDDDDNTGNAPTVTLSLASAQNIPGAVVSVTVTVNAPNGGETLVITGGVTNPDVTLSGDREEDVDVDITIPAGASVGSHISVVFTAVDTKNLSSLPIEFEITVGDPIVVLQGNLTTQTLDADTEYLLKSQVFIPSGVTLTIPSGTVIKGEKASKATLVVKPGGTLIANGTVTNPVIFTSSQRVGERDKGDWGGVIILGNAYVNQATQPSIEGISPAVLYGSVGDGAAAVTVNENESSGTLNYVRIEYGGIELSPNNETNSLTLGGVGRGTTINYVQASFGGDDGFEWFGGTVNAKYLISFGMWDDDFDTDFGWRGNVQYGLVVRYGPYADQSGSNGFESDTQAGTGIIAGKCEDGAAGGTNFFGCTQGVFSNITVLGPRDFNAGLSGSSVSRTISGSFQNAMHIRRQSMLSVHNSVFAGFPTGLKLDEAGTLNHLTNSRSKLANNVLLVPTNNVTGTAVTSTGFVYVTNIGTGDATAINTYFSGNNTVANTTAAALWSPTAGTPTGSVNPYTALGINQDLFWGGGTLNTNTNGRGINDYAASPNFAVSAGTILTGASFTGLPAFFTTTGTYKGAFGATDWTDQWTNFNPLTAVY